MELWNSAKKDVAEVIAEVMLPLGAPQFHRPSGDSHGESLRPAGGSPAPVRMGTCAGISSTPSRHLGRLNTVPTVSFFSQSGRGCVPLLGQRESSEDQCRTLARWSCEIQVPRMEISVLPRVGRADKRRVRPDSSLDMERAISRTPLSFICRNLTSEDQRPQIQTEPERRHTARDRQPRSRFASQCACPPRGWDRSFPTRPCRYSGRKCVRGEGPDERTPRAPECVQELF